MKEIPTAEFLKELSNDGFANYKKDVLEGPLFKKIITKIEDSALDGFTSWRQRIDRHDDVRALKVIQKELKSKGFYCEFVTEKKQGLIGSYEEKYFHIKWGE